MGCSSCSSTVPCDCADSGYQFSNLATTQPCVPEIGETSFVSNKGKFYDLTTEDSVIPSIGKEFYIHVCEANLWKTGIWIAINLPNNKFGVFKITQTGRQKIKLLNGLDKSGNNAVVGNPTPGTVIAANSLIYPAIPAGSDSMFVTKVISAIENNGVETLIKILKNAEEICFTNIPLISDEDGEVHLFGGTKPDCDCESGASVMSCLRKVLKIFTGQSGKTLCFPEVGITSSSPVEGVSKRLAIFDENRCLKRGQTVESLDSCSDSTVLENDAKFGAVIVCFNGNKVLAKPRKGYSLISVPTDADLPDGEYSWKIGKGGMTFYPLAAPVAILSTLNTPTTVVFADFPHNDCYGIFKLSITDQGSGIGFNVKLNDNIIIQDNWVDGFLNLQSFRISAPERLTSASQSMSINTIIGTASSAQLSLIGYMAYPH